MPEYGKINALTIKTISIKADKDKFFTTVLYNIIEQK